MTKKKLLALFLSIMMVMTFVTGCGSSTDVSSSVEQATEHVVTDMAGREVTIPADVEKIGTFGSIGVINAFVELMGEGDKICNEMSENFTKSDKWAYQYKFAPQLKECPVFEVGGEVDIETVLATAPDVCIVMSQDLVDTLEAQGLTVVYIEWNSVDDVKDCVNLLGEVFGKEDVAEDYCDYFDKMVAKANDVTKDLADADKKTVVYGNILEYTQPHSIAEWWIAQAGGISVTDDGREDGSREYTAEDLLGWNPEYMFISSASDKAEIEADTVLSQIQAVKDGNIYAVPTVAHVWGNRTPEQPLTVLWATNKLYPDLYTEDELSEDIAYFYSHFYNYEMSDDEIDGIINYGA